MLQVFSTKQDWARCCQFQVCPQLSRRNICMQQDVGPLSHAHTQTLNFEKALSPNGHLGGRVAAEEAAEFALMWRNVRVNLCCLCVCVAVRWVCLTLIFPPAVHYGPCSCAPVSSSFPNLKIYKDALP